jgi:hypothetical protein
MKAALVRIWERWKVIAHWIADKQTTAIYAILYVLVVGPIAIVRRMFTDPLRYRRRAARSFWVPRPNVVPSLDDARRQ